MIGWWVDEEEGAMQGFSDMVCTQRFLEHFRYAFTNRQTLEYPEDAYPYIGHHANDLILDNIEYEKISVKVNQDLGFIPSQQNYQNNSGRADFVYGNVLTISSEDKYDDFSGYLYPTSESYNSQADNLITKLDAATDRDKVLELLAIIPETEYKKISTGTRLNSIKLIAEGNITEDYTSCINDEEIIINLFTHFIDDDSKIQLKESLETEKLLLKELYSKVSGDNRARLINAISDIVVESWEEGGISVNSNKHYIWNDIMVDVKGRYENNGDINVWSHIIPISAFSENPIPINDNNLSPFEPIAVCFNNGQTASEDNIVYLPAIYLYWMADEKAKEEGIQAISFFLNFVGTVSATKILLTGGTALVRAIAIAELTNFTLNRLIYSTAINQRLQNTEEGQAFLDVWPAIKYSH